MVHEKNLFTDPSKQRREHRKKIEKRKKKEEDSKPLERKRKSIKIANSKR